MTSVTNFCHSKLEIGKVAHFGEIQDFSVIQILCDFNFGESRSSSLKLPFFAILGALNFLHLVEFSLQRVQKLIKNKIQNL